MASAKQVIDRLRVDGYLTPNALSTLLALTPPTIHKCVQDNKINATRVSGKIHIYVPAIYGVLCDSKLTRKANRYTIEMARKACEAYVREQSDKQMETEHD